MEKEESFKEEREVLTVKCSSIQVSKNLKDPVNRQLINSNFNFNGVVGVGARGKGYKKLNEVRETIGNGDNSSGSFNCKGKING